MSRRCSAWELTLTFLQLTTPSATGWPRRLSQSSKLSSRSTKWASKAGLWWLDLEESFRQGQAVTFSNKLSNSLSERTIQSLIWHHIISFINQGSVYAIAYLAFLLFTLGHLFRNGLLVQQDQSMAVQHCKFLLGDGASSKCCTRNALCTGDDICI